ncbi:MAG: GNAT family N-acetyltransferase [Eubacteriales bacterium]|nr:GNAT family N-acetyltransferase [Eubacteriales bacterium]
MRHIGTQPIQTPRLLLRRITPADAQDMFTNWAGDEEVTRYLTWPAHRTLADSQAVIAMWIEQLEQDDCYRWCIQYRANSR